MLRTPNIFLQFEKVISGESNRLGGVSDQPFDSLNLGLSTGDLTENVWENRRLFFGSMGIELSQVALSHQVHEDKILLTDVPGFFSGYDAIITASKQVYLAVSTADCVPILLYDAYNHAVAAIHAGWPGTHKQIVYKTLQMMEETFGTKGTDCYVSIGTCIDEDVYEVGEEVAVLFADEHKIFRPEKRKFHLRLKAANQTQLTDFGVLPENIEIFPFCTYTNNDLYFSHRKEKGSTGRMLSVIGIEK